MVKKIVRLTESELKEVVKNATISIIRENGLLKDDELMEYARLDKSKTGLNVDVFVDDGGAYKRYGHPLWVYVRNGYLDIDPIFHIEVSDKPSVPQIQLNLKEIDLEAILAFISQNADLLKLFADEEIEHLDFYKMCKPIIYSYSTSSKDVSVNEMATLRPKTSGLPTILWIDEGTQPQHWKRIKFMASKDQLTTLDFSSMSISQNPQIFNPPRKYDLSKKDLERIINFVKANEANLLKVANKEMTFEQFLGVMVKT